MFFVQETEVCNFIDDTTIYSCSPNFEEATLKLFNETLKFLNWFRINSMVANPGKFQIMFLRSNIDHSKITFVIDDKLLFATHIENLCSTASNRLRALARIRRFIPFEQAKRLSEAYIVLTFTYCALIWMYCSKTANNLINKIHKRSLGVKYEMEDANFEYLLIKESSWAIHKNNIHTFFIEICKSINHISPPIM